MATGTKAERDFIAYVGSQGSGKTYQLAAEVTRLRGDSRVSCVWIFDRFSEFDDVAIPCYSWRQWRDEIAARNGRMPRAVAWRLGIEPEDYQWLYARAIQIGSIALILDEAYEFFGQSATKIEPAELRQIVFAGRHLPTASGELAPIHVVYATQYPRTIAPRIWAQANQVYVSQLVGESSRQWLAATYGKEMAEHAIGLKRRQWIRVWPVDD